MIEKEMFTYKQIIVTFIFAVANLVYASDISYDQQNITPQTWQEVDLSYVHKINGKDYTEQAKLLRPTTWLEQYHLDKVGRLVAVHESDVGSDATVKVVAIKPSILSFSSQSHQNNHPVIGTFLKYSDDVWSYTFSNGETIEATSNHPFYDVDKKQYIPIGEFQLNGDHLLTDDNTKAQLSSKIKHNKGVETVYNIEVYQAHNYYISQKIAVHSLLVHNGPCSNARLTENAKSNLENAQTGRYFVGLLNIKTGEVNIGTSTRKLVDIDRYDGINGIELSGDIVDNEEGEIVPKNKLGRGEYEPIQRFTANQSGASTPGHITMLSQLHDINFLGRDNNLANTIPTEREEILLNAIKEDYAGFGGLITNNEPREINLTWDSRSLNQKFYPNASSYQLPQEYQNMIREMFTSNGFKLFTGDISSSRL